MRAVGVALFLLTLALSTRVDAASRITRITLAPDRVTLSPTIKMEGFARNIRPGQPPLPERQIAVALHPRADLSSLRIELKSGPVDTLPGRHLLGPNPTLRLHPLEASWGATKPLAAAFSSRIFPARVISRQRITNRRGLLVLYLRYTPLRYRHSHAELLLDRHTEVTIRYSLKRGKHPRPDPLLTPYLERVINPTQARRWYRTGPSGKPGYAIIIPDSLSKESKRLEAFIEHKASLGLEVTVVGDEDLSPIAVGPAGGDAERVRIWLQNNYKELNLKFVLLIGNPDPRRDGVPMKLTHSLAHYDSPISPPSDHYYADLTSNWDLDGDGKVAEVPDDTGSGGLDLTPEVYVGRIPVYSGNVLMLDQILDKFVAYATEQGDRSWRSRVLQPAAIYWYAKQYGDSSYYRVDGATVADVINDEIIEPLGFSRTLLNEQFGVNSSTSEGDLALDRDNLVTEWNKGYGLVTWFGHGLADSVSRTVWATDDGDGIPGYQELFSPDFFAYDDVALLDDTRPSFVFHGSCLNGRPERSDNLAYGLLRSGAVGTVAASRSAIISFLNTGSSGDRLAAVWGTIFGAARDFTDAMLQKKSAGEALFLAKEKVNPQLEDLAWFTQIELNLYGDPSLSMISCNGDADCDDGDACTGTATCVAGQCIPGTRVSCESDDPCTEAQCDPATGECVQTSRPEGEACEDGTFCTVNKTCQGGVCIGQPRCAAEGNPCVLAICDEQNRTCDVYPAAEEGQVCHEGTDREGTCSAGICQPSSSGCTVASGHPPFRATSPALPVLLVALMILARRKRRR